MKTTTSTTQDFDPGRSLALIEDTLDRNRRAILARSGRSFFLWGALLGCFSLAIWLLWSRTGHPAWNLLWFCMLPVGWLAARGLAGEQIPENVVSVLLRRIWWAFGIFATAVSALALIAFPMNLNLVILLLFGFAAALSGILLKSVPVLVAGAVVGIGGACAVVRLAAGPGQLLLFVGAAAVLVLTGVILQARR